MATITAKHRWTADELGEMTRAHGRASHGPIARYVLHALSATSMILVLFSFWMLVRSKFEGFVTLLPVYVMVPAVFGFIYFMMFANRLLGRLSFRFFQENAKDVEWTLSEDGLQTRTSLTMAAFSWAAVTKVVETPRGFLVYQNRFIFHWIPGSAFASPLDARHFARMAEERAPRYVLLGECVPQDAMPAGPA